MAYSSAELSAADIALAAADKPIILGRNWLRDVSDLDWRESGSFDTGADAPHATGPTSYAYDDFDHLRTFPATAENDWSLIMDLGATDPGIIDSVAILNHNLGTLGSVQTDIEIDDNSDFSTAVTVATDTPTTDKRLVFLELFHTGSVALRYSAVRYIRIRFTGTGIQPKVGEVILSRRRQLKHKSNLPWDPNALSSLALRHETDSGIMTDYVKHKKRRRISALLNPHEDAFIGDLESFYEDDTDGGTQHFLWIDDPNTSPTDANWMQLDVPRLSGPLNGFTERRFAIAASEQGPNFLKLGT